ncbi:MAG TPA: SusD/RagB family nutrient-binding outer membrane lipoprotein [Puia sp.]|jgi:hypothetical protein|nr:SusD/RagB family nutrient-binding outer membrane lipoprotein [Puia sp.]
MKKIFYMACVSMLMGALLTGCTKKFADINTNPAGYSKANFEPNYILTTVQQAYTGSTDFSYDTWRANLIYCSTMMQGFSTVVGYWVGDKYILNPSYTAAYWGFGSSQGPPLGNGGDGAYPEQVKPVVDLIEFTKDMPQYKNLYQIARLMRALIMERITDLYGDCPYSQAGLGYYDKTFFPQYDKQQDIYMDLLKEIDDATGKLDMNGDQPSGDVFYNGNPAQWKRFGYTLMLRVAMRLVKVDPTTAQTYAQKAVGNTFTDNGDNAFVKGDNTGGRVTINRNSQILDGDGGQENIYTKWSNTFIDMLRVAEDPRMAKIAITHPTWDASKNPTGGNADTSVQKGMPNGHDLSGIAGLDISTVPGYTSIADYSSPSQYLTKRDGVTFILTYAESELLLAEAAQRWGIGGSAAQHYHDGVKAAITYLSQYDPGAAISDGDAETWLTAHPYNAADGLNQINTQYWIHTNTMLDFYESWSNWRRSGFPVLTPVVYPNNNTNGTIPRRFPYPTDEANTNPVNYKTAHDAVPGGDNLTGRVWWDKE